MAIYAGTFKSMDELAEAVSRKELGDESGEYKNWVAVVVQDQSSSNIRMSSSQVGNMLYSYLHWNSYSKLVYGHSFDYSSVDAILCEDNEALLLEDESILLVESSSSSVASNV